MSSKQILLPFIFLTLINILLPLLEAQPEARARCFDDRGNYTSNSTYASNLNTVLSYLSPNIGNNGFYNASFGRGIDQVNAIALCRGDLQLDFCRRCVQNAIADLVRLCPYQMQSFVHLVNCMVRYSNDTILGIPETTYSRPWWNVVTARSPDQFNRDLRTLLDGLEARASNGSSLLKVAVANISSADFLTIFGMVQCTPDLSSDNCIYCLRSAAQRIPECCNNLQGGRINLASCYIRYEIYNFYNETRLTELEMVPSPPPQNAPGNSSENNNDGNNNNNNTNNTTPTTIIIIVVPTVAGVFSLLVLAWLMLRKRAKNISREGTQTVDDISIDQSLHYDLEKIKVATNDFSEANKLGEGGFGSVYKGILPDGQIIAVKRLSRNSNQGDLEFKNEVMFLARLQHRNLVRLLGFSIQGNEKLLVYEYVQNLSLDHILFDRTKHSQLNWDRRYKIIGGTAKGILYLHEDSRLRIIHRDLKASNVLLDGEMNPKISDFGMAKLFEVDETHASTSRIAGTYGYMAPEYAIYGRFSIKSDVFSFGVIVLEIISGQRKGCFRLGSGNVEDLLTSAWESWRKGSVDNFVDPLLKEGVGVPHDILRCLQMGLLCVQENAVDRPTMASVVLMLNSNSITLAIPSKPAFYVNNESEVPLLGDSNATTREGEYINSAESDLSSQNDMSISEFYAR